MKVRPAAQILGVGAGGSHELMEEALQSINKIEIKTAG
jgi:hypothetical protein